MIVKNKALKKILNKRRWRILKFYCLGWTLAFIFLSIVRGLGTTEEGSLQFDFLSSIKIALTLGPIMGLVSGYVQITTEERIYKYTSVQRFFLIRFAYGILSVVLLIVGAYSIYQLYFGTSISLWTFASDEGSAAIYFYVLFTDSFLSVMRQVSLMLGEGNLTKLLQGKFYTPREETRIFMFLDLQSSTSLAEQLGHIRYSLLIQDCFNYLGITIENEAEVYQYVGDEAVLTWPLEVGLQNQNCLRAFYKFTDLLKEKSGHYREKYNCEPRFKAGMHGGVVTVTEVGKYKIEIAYHGDAINTAARIQGQCNLFNEELLISETLKKQLEHKQFTFKTLGSIPLKGKKEEVSICSVSMIPKVP
ncbi:MAG: adenylate/guanylate cyclase domain-containing protein [Bacteroidota bacterium]